MLWSLRYDPESQNSFDDATNDKNIMVLYHILMRKIKGQNDETNIVFFDNDKENCKKFDNFCYKYQKILKMIGVKEVLSVPMCHSNAVTNEEAKAKGILQQDCDPQFSCDKILKELKILLEEKVSDINLPNTQKKPDNKRFIKIRSSSANPPQHNQGVFTRRFSDPQKPKSNFFNFF